MKRKNTRRSMVFGTALLALLAFMAPSKNDLPVETSEFVVEVNPDLCPNPNQTFQGGEVIEYKLYYNLNFIWIAAGKITFRVDDLGDSFKISADGRTISSFDWFFKVRDKYEVIMDKETMLPISSKRDVVEGKYKLYEEITWDRSNNKAVSLRGKSKEKAVLREFELTSCTQDILSVMYHARNLDYPSYQPGQKFPINIFMDKEEWPLQGTYLGKDEEKKIKGLGKFNTAVFQPEVISGDVFNSDTEMYIWTTNDANRLPLLIETPISVGSVKAVLKNYEGLRHDMTARIN
ncbi:MAG: DUF3108 domain-containing protein [Saprospiraceae bacterium]|nr:DUF3108 domain-containing protein [Saprospiraceae bacterium]